MEDNPLAVEEYEEPVMVEVGDFAEVTLGPHYVGIWDGYGAYSN
ncbi:lasso RiPP family leader peptide-containing protein [Streptomyces flavofungini]